jgi:hypothetical protein
MQVLHDEADTATGNPLIRVEFILDDQGNPQASTHKDRLGTERRHYGIRMWLASPPSDAWGVTFKLHESYYDPVRETTGPDFSFETTTYGDYKIRARIFGKKFVSEVSVNLSDALRASYANPGNSKVIEAIDEIAQN